MDNCLIDNNYYGVFWQAVGSGGWIRDTGINAMAPQYPIAINLLAYGVGNGIVLERCRVERAQTIIKDAQGVSIIDCQFRDYIIGISIYDNAQVVIYQSAVSNMSSIGIEFSLGSGGNCEIRDCEISGGVSALDTGGYHTGGRFAAYDSRIQGGTVAALHARYRPGPCVIHNCDLVKGTGPIIWCGASTTSVNHDLSNNYWGTTSAADIETWIIDRNDDPNVAATVLYQPFVGQSVPTESTSWGDLKALFR